MKKNMWILLAALLVSGQLRAQKNNACISETGTVLRTPVCDNYFVTAAMVGENLNTQPDMRTSIDKKISCVRKAGYTLDFPDCAKVLTLYNFTVNAEQAMFLQQKITMDMKNKQISAEVAKETAEGNGQQAAIDATTETNTNLLNMNRQQEAVYAAAIGALSSGIMAWQGKKSAALAKLCAKKFPMAQEKIASQGISTVVDATTCTKAVASAYQQSNSDVFANDVAKGAFVTATTGFIQKGIAAGIRAADLKKYTELMEQTMVAEETQDLLIDRCVLNPMDPLCLAPGSLVDGPTYQGADFTIGDGTGNNAFNANGDGSEFGIPGDPTNLSPVERLADINSPFNNEADKANKILDEAAAASVQSSGGSAGGGGGGGVGGGMGGGSASLGTDLDGADKNENKEPDIKSGKHTAAYSKGGTSFGAIKSSKDDENPFSSLFDSKGASGGVEEDRSIASSDIDGSASGLFQKISRRYEQIQADKRLEASNLE